MKKETIAKYPHSAKLFQFCRKVLDHKFGGIRVIDQDVGQILGFDPADCSHWKKGKKNIKSIHAMKSIADHLGVDDKLVVDVASGEVSDFEAFFEYAGYGALEVDSKILDLAKKDFYRKNANIWSRETEAEFKAHFVIDEQKISQLVQTIHNNIGFKEAPLYIPELIAAYPSIKLSPTDELFDGDGSPFPVSISKKGDTTDVSYPASIKMKPYIRYQIAKSLAEFFLDPRTSFPKDLIPHMKHIREVQSNLFAAKLLTPVKLMRQELTNIDVSKDIVTQLAEIFWVSKTFMNRRLKEILAEPAQGMLP